MPPPRGSPSTCRSNDAPPFPPVTAAPPVTSAPPVTPTAPSTAVAPTVPNPSQGRGGRPRAESQQRKRDAAAAGVQSAARDAGGAGDSLGRDSGATSRESRPARSQSSKRRRRSLSRRRDPRPFVPFPLQEQDGRFQAVRLLFEEAAEHSLAPEMSLLRGLRESYPNMEGEELHRLNNQVLVMIAEYHLTSACQGSRSIPPVPPRRHSSADASFGWVPARWYI